MAIEVIWQLEIAKRISAMNNNPPRFLADHMVAELHCLHRCHLLILRFLMAK